jgi:RNA polymerase sigma-70 factor (ECF subfamily)
LGLKLGADSDTIKECIQDVFNDLWTYRQSLSDIESFEAYLKTSLKRRIFKILNKIDKNKIVNDALILEQELSVQSYEDVLIEQQSKHTSRNELLKTLSLLSPRQKEVILLKYFEEMSYVEIADKMSVQVDTVYKILHEALKKLKNIMSPQ